jgi:hypothetical protein
MNKLVSYKKNLISIYFHILTYQTPFSSLSSQQPNQSLRIVPAPGPQPSETVKNVASTANSFGVHDTFRYGAHTIESEIQPKHPLENHLNKVARE